MNNAYRAAVAAILALSAAGLNADDSADWAIGDWKGTLEAGGQQLEILYRLGIDSDGAWIGSMDVPAQGATGLALRSIEVSEHSVSIQMPLPGDASYRGKWLADEERVEGRFVQGEQTFSMVLERAEPGQGKPSRPQDPKPPLPYRSESVQFISGGTVLAGTLAVPEQVSALPGVVLVAGAGPHDRDGTFMGHRPLLVLADHLTRAGFSVLRFDERGVGESEGEFAPASAELLARDIAAASRFMREHPSTDPGAVAIVAHSEGGRISALAIERHQAAELLVLLGSPARPGIAELRSQAPRAANPMAKLQLEMAEAAIGLDPEADFESTMNQAAQRALSDLEPDELAAFGGNEEIIADQLAQALSQPQSRFSLRFDPRPALKAADVPVLALYGGKDGQIDAAGAARDWRAALGENAEIRTLDGLNHFFQQAETGAPTEYRTIAETISPAALTAITQWLESNRAR